MHVHFTCCWHFIIYEFMNECSNILFFSSIVIFTLPNISCLYSSVFVFRLRTNLNYRYNLEPFLFEIIIFTFYIFDLFFFSVVNFQFSSTKHVFVHTFSLVFFSQTQHEQHSWNSNKIKNDKKNTHNFYRFQIWISLCWKINVVCLFFACLNYCHHIYSMHFERTFNQMEI